MAIERDFDDSGFIDLLKEVLKDPDIVTWKEGDIKTAVEKALEELGTDLNDQDYECTVEAEKAYLNLASLYDSSLVAEDEDEEEELEDEEEDFEFEDEDELTS